eukprot:gene3037-5047_t
MSNSQVVLVTASYDHTVKFWEATSTVCYQTIQFNDSQVNCLAISNNKDILASGSHLVIRLYSIDSNSQQPIASFEGHTGNIMALGFQKQDKCEDKTIRIWDLKSLSCKKKYQLKSSVNALCLYKNQAELIAGEEDGKISIYDLTKDECVFEKNLHGSVGIRSISSVGNFVVSANNKGMVDIWNYKDSKLELLLSFEAHSNYILKCLISPNLQYIVTTSADYTIRVWDFEGKLKKELKEHKRWVWDAAFSSDSAYLVSCSSDGTAKLWDISKGDSIKTYKGHQKACVCVALHDLPKTK